MANLCEINMMRIYEFNANLPIYEYQNGKSKFKNKFKEIEERN
jgi:hypothetical protein